MKKNKKEILKKHCYTELVYSRINKKLDINLSKEENEELIEKALKETGLKYYEKKGKNFYITNKKYNMKITVNSTTFRVITVDRISKIYNL